jgi:peptide/nickel transport system substrate-binding protein
MLAESWRSLDEKTWEFKLRQGVKFHNGEPFTAESVKFTLECIIDPELKSAQAFLWAPLQRVEVKDAAAALIRTKAPFGPLLSTLTMTGMLPARAGRESGFFAKPAGTGAFRIVRVLKGDRIELEANTDWWKGSPRLAKLTFRYIGEASTRVASRLGGETQVVDRVSPDVMRQIERSARHGVARKRSVESRIIGFHVAGGGPAGAQAPGPGRAARGRHRSGQLPVSQATRKQHERRGSPALAERIQLLGRIGCVTGNR